MKQKRKKEKREIQLIIFLIATHTLISFHLKISVNAYTTNLYTHLQINQCKSFQYSILKYFRCENETFDLLE